MGPALGDADGARGDGVDEAGCGRQTARRSAMERRVDGGKDVRMRGQTPMTQEMTVRGVTPMVK